MGTYKYKVGIHVPCRKPIFFTDIKEVIKVDTMGQPVGYGKY